VLATPIPTDLDHAARVLAAVERKKLCHVMEAALRRCIDERRALILSRSFPHPTDAFQTFAPAAQGFTWREPLADRIAFRIEPGPERG